MARTGLFNQRTQQQPRQNGVHELLIPGLFLACMGWFVLLVGLFVSYIVVLSGLGLIVAGLLIIKFS